MDPEVTNSIIGALFVKDASVRVAMHNLAQLSLSIRSSRDADEPYIIRKLILLAEECPYDEIRSLSYQFLQLHKISYDAERVKQVSLKNLEIPARSDELQYMCFNLMGKYPHFMQILSPFPEYSSKFLQLLQEIVYESGPLPLETRFFIAYLGASSHNCEYLMKFWKEQARSFDTLPEKVRFLTRANTMLAHQPWHFNKECLQELMSEWHTSEMLHALIILAVMHSLSSIILGLGIQEEYDLGSFEVVISDNFQLKYVDYNISVDPRPVRPSDFNWIDQGFYILERVMSSIADRLQETIRFAFSMTFETLGGEEGVNTAPLRKAIWIYTQRVYGLEYDDYNYKDVNDLIKQNTKKYVKFVACTPETNVLTLYDAIDMNFSQEDKIHLNILVFNARLESELMYITHAFQEFNDR